MVRRYLLLDQLAVVAVVAEIDPHDRFPSNVQQQNDTLCKFILSWS